MYNFYPIHHCLNLNLPIPSPFKFWNAMSAVYIFDWNLNFELPKNPVLYSSWCGFEDQGPFRQFNNQQPPQK